MAKVRVGNTYISFMNGEDCVKFELLIYELIHQLADTQPNGIAFDSYQDYIRFQLTVLKVGCTVTFTFPKSLNQRVGIIWARDMIQEKQMTYISKSQSEILIDGFSIDHVAQMIVLRIAQWLAPRGYRVVTRERDVQHSIKDDRGDDAKAWVWQYACLTDLQDAMLFRHVGTFTD